MADPYQRISYLLKALEKEMRSLDLWSSTPPAEQALASSMPFCYDTLDFSEWLQWIFIPRLHLLLYETLPLAVKSEIAPMAELWIKEQALGPETNTLLGLIREFDQVLSVDR